MMKTLIDGMVQINAKLAEAAKEIIVLLSCGKSVDLIVQQHEEVKPRSIPQNSLIYSAYKRIADTLYGGDELHARRECKLLFGCQILYRENAEFRKTFDVVIRPLPHDIRLISMDLISVSSLMTVKQCKSYITDIFNQYTLIGCYFADLDGSAEYLKYPENNRCLT